jgi:hypothetical protein
MWSGEFTSKYERIAVTFLATFLADLRHNVREGFPLAEH